MRTSWGKALARQAWRISRPAVVRPSDVAWGSRALDMTTPSRGTVSDWRVGTEACVSLLYKSRFPLSVSESISFDLLLSPRRSAFLFSPGPSCLGHFSLPQLQAVARSIPGSCAGRRPGRCGWDACGWAAGWEWWRAVPAERIRSGWSHGKEPPRPPPMSPVEEIGARCPTTLSSALNPPLGSGVAP